VALTLLYGVAAFGQITTRRITGANMSPRCFSLQREPPDRSNQQQVGIALSHNMRDGSVLPGVTADRVVSVDSNGWGCRGAGGRIAHLGFSA
jgi:hypothetical protein